MIICMLSHTIYEQSINIILFLMKQGRKRAYPISYSLSRNQPKFPNFFHSPLEETTMKVMKAYSWASLASLMGIFAFSRSLLHTLILPYLHRALTN